MKNRLLSLDAYRGLTMFFLMGEAALMYEALTHLFPEGKPLHGLALQFHHHPWNGLRFWDLIKPFFMFIVGVAMPFSLRSRLITGVVCPFREGQECYWSPPLPIGSMLLTC